MYFGFGQMMFVITARKHAYTINGLRRIYELIGKKTDNIFVGFGLIGWQLDELFKDRLLAESAHKV